MQHVELIYKANHGQMPASPLSDNETQTITRLYTLLADMKPTAYISQTVNGITTVTFRHEQHEPLNTPNTAPLQLEKPLLEALAKEPIRWISGNQWRLSFGLERARV